MAQHGRILTRKCLQVQNIFDACNFKILIHDSSSKFWIHEKCILNKKFYLINAITQLETRHISLNKFSNSKIYFDLVEKTTRSWKLLKAALKGVIFYPYFFSVIKTIFSNLIRLEICVQLFKNPTYIVERISNYVREITRKNRSCFIILCKLTFLVKYRSFTKNV